MNVIFNRPVKLYVPSKDPNGKMQKYTLYPASRRSVVLDDKLAEDWFVKALMEDGGISIAASGPPKAGAKPAQAAK